VSEQGAGVMAALLVAHFLGDFTPLATARMQEAKAVGRPLGPITAHSFIHAVLVAIAVGLAARPGWQMVGAAAAIEFWTHLAIDWTRGRMGAAIPALSDSGDQQFWTALGLDQLAHGLVLVWIAWLVFWLPL
jgi:hypothetical protein